MRSVGPAIGGFLSLWFGPAGNFFVQAGAYALVALTIVELVILAIVRIPRRTETV
jgi:hypothetical protein